VTDGAIVVDPKDIRRLVADEVARAVAPILDALPAASRPDSETATAEDRMLSQEELAEFLASTCGRFADLNTRVAFHLDYGSAREPCAGSGPRSSGTGRRNRAFLPRLSAHRVRRPGRHTDQGAAGSEGDAMRPDSVG